MVISVEPGIESRVVFLQAGNPRFVGKKDVRKSIPNEIENGHAAQHAVDHSLLRRRAVVENKADARGSPALKTNRPLDEHRAGEERQGDRERQKQHQHPWYPLQTLIPPSESPVIMTPIRMKVNSKIYFRFLW